MTICLICGPAVKTREIIDREVLKWWRVLSVVRFCLVVQEKCVFGMHDVRGYRRGQCNGNKVQLVDEGFF